MRASRPPPLSIPAATHTESASGAAATAFGLASTGISAGSPPGSTRVTCRWVVLATQRLAKARPGPPGPTGPDPDAGRVSWTWLVAGLTTVTVPSCRLATHTDPPPAATAAGLVPTATAATSW